MAKKSQLLICVSVFFLILLPFPSTAEGNLIGIYTSTFDAFTDTSARIVVALVEGGKWPNYPILESRQCSLEYQSPGSQSWMVVAGKKIGLDYWEFTMAGLQSATQYKYRVTCDGTTVENSFATSRYYYGPSAAPPSPLAFATLPMVTLTSENVPVFEWSLGTREAIQDSAVYLRKKGALAWQVLRTGTLTRYHNVTLHLDPGTYEYYVQVMNYWFTELLVSPTQEFTVTEPPLSVTESQLYDLTVRSARLLADGTVNIDVCNNGPGTLPQFPYILNVDGKDVIEVTILGLPPLDLPGKACTTRNLPYILPKPVPDQIYRAVIIADPQDKVKELDETNNRWTGSLVVTKATSAGGSTTSDSELVRRLAGRILLQVQGKGEAWYVDEKTQQRFYLRDGSTAYEALRKFGTGITDIDLAKIPIGIESRATIADADGDGLDDKLEEAIGTNPNIADSDGDGYLDGIEVQSGYNPRGTGKSLFNIAFGNQLKGKILLQVQGRGQAWYINPTDSKRYYLKDGNAAYQIMKYLSLGATNDTISKIPVGELK